MLTHWLWDVLRRKIPEYSKSAHLRAVGEIFGGLRFELRQEGGGINQSGGGVGG